ncbi:hypothetical protein, partial [Herminiimonas contaminans]|uniref:hypothetical protein n=1 Tax=Herminiimonas contaminans TaxID=1111140 RepID=UPI001E64469C
DASGDVEAGGQSVCHSVRRTLHQRIALEFFNRPSHTEFLTLPIIHKLSTVFTELYTQSLLPYSNGR